jgi:hypothetical protein
MAVRTFGISRFSVIHATAAGLLLAASFQADAAARDSRIDPLPAAQTVQPWGKGELTIPEGTNSAVFDLKEPLSAAYHQVQGDVLLPEAGSVLAFPDGKFTAGLDKARQPAVDISLAKSRSSVGLASNDMKTAWLPFSLARMGTACQVKLGTNALALSQAPAGDGALSLTLQKGAKLRNVRVTRLPAGMAVASLADVSVPVAGLDPASVTNGLVTVDGVPFVLDGKAVDVGLSMAGSDFSRRLKWGYLSVPPATNRPICSVPGKGYAALHVLAYSRRLSGRVPRMTLNSGLCTSWSGDIFEEVVSVPDLQEGGESPYVQSRVPVKLADGKDGWLYHLRIPVPRTATTWFTDGVSFEFSRDKVDLHNLPDPNEFMRVPAGLPSSVMVLSATAERSPVAFSVVLGPPGNVFESSQDPVITVALTNRSAVEFKGRILARSSGPGTVEEDRGLRSDWTVETAVTLKPGEGIAVPVSLMPEARRKLGWFEAEFIVDRAGRPLQTYKTTYAVLPPDTRKALADSPFGIWEFWWPHTSFTQKDRHVRDAASLINKGGWRWTYGGDAKERSRGETVGPETLFNDYKITYTLRNPPQGYQREAGWWNAEEFETSIAPALRAAAASPVPGVDRVYKVLHESRSSTTITRRRSEFLDGEPYPMPEAEKAQIDTQFSNVVQYCAAIKKADPRAKICLINDYPAVGLEYMKRGMPKDLFDSFGSEGAMFMREPERQPDWLSLLGIMQEWKRAKAQYGYDHPVWTTEALYHSTGPANVPLHAQGSIQVREAMLALANGVQRMCAAGCLRDCTDDYRWSNWGQSGFCFREPEMNPKPVYPRYAFLTLVLDRAAFAGKLETGSTSLHVLDFKTPEGAHVYPVWCVRGRQTVILSVMGGRPVVYDAYGNVQPIKAADSALVLSASDTPVYVAGTTVSRVAGHKAEDMKPGAIPSTPLLAFDRPGLFTVEPSSNKVLEANWDYPRIKGSYAVEQTIDGTVSVARLELRDDADSRKLLQRYVELKLAQPVALTNPVEAITARVKGNGGWGRLMFELVDAEGRIWTSCGNQYSGSCNSSDNPGDSYVSFDGWRTMVIKVPGRLPARDLVAFRPSTTCWWPENTPEFRQQTADYQKAMADFTAAKAAFPALKKEHDAATQVHYDKVAQFARDKAAFDKGQAEYAAAQKAYARAQKDYDRAKQGYDKAVKEGKAPAAAPVAPEAPTAPVLTAPVPPGDAPKAIKEPAPPGQLRNYGIADLTYPVKLTKVIFAASPEVLYVNDQVPVKDRVILIEKIGVKAE